MSYEQSFEVLPFPVQPEFGEMETFEAEFGESSEFGEIDMPPIVVAPCPTLPKTFVVDQYSKEQRGVGPVQVTQLNPVVLALLRGLSKKCRTPLKRVNVVGHASTEGSAAFNLTVGKARAAAVRGFLEASMGVLSVLTPVTFSHSSAGESRPLVSPERSEADRKRNRRVEITLLP
jgi:hypothetical protein